MKKRRVRTTRKEKYAAILRTLQPLIGFLPHLDPNLLVWLDMSVHNCSLRRTISSAKSLGIFVNKDITSNDNFILVDTWIADFFRKSSALRTWCTFYFNLKMFGNSLYFSRQVVCTVADPMNETMGRNGIAYLCMHFMVVCKAVQW